MDPMKLGMGGRFKALQAKLEASGNSKEAAGAIAANAGRAKYGSRKMAALSQAGKRRRNKR